MATTPAAADILRHISAYHHNLLSQHDLRRRLLSYLLRPQADNVEAELLRLDHTTSKTLLTAARAIESSISSSSPSSLHLTETTLLSLPIQSSTSSLLLSLIHAITHRPVDAALYLLHVFALDPSAARSEIAPVVFEDLFVYHLYPALQWFKDQRSRILQSRKAPDLRRSRSSIGMGLISAMSGDETAELKELEGAYEEVVDENTRAFAVFLKEVVQGRDVLHQSQPPALVFDRIGDHNKIETQERVLRVEEDGSILDEYSRHKQQRYNPLWAEEGDYGSSSIDLSPPTATRPPSPTPQSVPISNLASPATSSSSQASSSESELDDTEETSTKLSLFDRNYLRAAREESNSSPSSVSATKTTMADGGKQTPPKDFVCPITNHIFVDPVTLETGQTYERRAIQEWLERGNSTCPITRQQLHNSHLPKTNYVLKRLIAGWKEQNPTPAPATSYEPTKPSSSPTSVIIQASMDGDLGQLRTAISNLCSWDVLEESEKAVLRIEQFWREAGIVSETQALLSKPAVINGFVEILFNSIDPRVLRASVFLLAELASRDTAVVQTLTRVESDMECVVALFKKGLLESVVLVYLLGPSLEQLLEMDMNEALVRAIKKQGVDVVGSCVKPRTAAIVLLGQIVRGVDGESAGKVARAVALERALESIVACLEEESVIERVAAVGILLRCMEEEGGCRRAIAEKVDLTAVLETFVGCSDGERFEIVAFLCELVKQNKRLSNEQLLHRIRDGGSFSTMHSLLIYLQAASQDQSPVVAGLLLQLDLLTPPRKMSIYREEAIEALAKCLKNAEFPGAQITAAETIMALQGRFSSSGKPLARAYLLKRAGLEKNYKAIIRANRHSKEILKEEEEKAAEEWEKRMAFALAGHEFGLIFEALSEGLNSKYGELSRACFESATWLVNMLSALPNTGVRGAARVCLLKTFISIFNTARNPEDKALSMLALKSFIEDPEGLHEVTINVKGILKNLRELRKSSVLATEMLKDLSEGQDPSSIELWTHKELSQVDCSINGEVMCVTCFKEMVFSGHSDGSIKVWSGKGNLYLGMEIKEHTKAITSLQVQPSGEKLYSGSLDRTVRVWTIGGELVKCIQLYDMKDQVQFMVVANSICCFIPQGAGVKVQSWNGSSKLLNPNKYVRCLGLLQGKLYCGCSDNSIQEIDLVSGTLSSIQQGNRKLLGKTNPIYALQVHNGLLYSAGAPTDGGAVKIWNISNYSLVGSLSSSPDIRIIVVTSELIYLGCKNGMVEIWSREKHNKVGTLHAGTNIRVTCMVLNDDEDMLLIGTSDGRIQVWGLG